MVVAGAGSELEPAAIHDPGTLQHLRPGALGGGKDLNQVTHCTDHLEPQTLAKATLHTAFF